MRPSLTGLHMQVTQHQNQCARLLIFMEGVMRPLSVEKASGVRCTAAMRSNPLSFLALATPASSFTTYSAACAWREGARTRW